MLPLICFAATARLTDGDGPHNALLPLVCNVMRNATAHSRNKGLCDRGIAAIDSKLLVLTAGRSHVVGPPNPGVKGAIMGLFENVRNETVSRLALRPTVIIESDATVRDVVEQLREAHLGCAIATDADGKPRGMFTEAMLRSLIAQDPAAINEPVESHLAKTFPWVKTSDRIETVLAAMEAKNVRFVVVVDDDGAVVGLTGQKGLMEYVAEHFPGEVLVQRVGTKAYPEKREGA